MNNAIGFYDFAGVPTEASVALVSTLGMIMGALCLPYFTLLLLPESARIAMKEQGAEAKSGKWIRVVAVCAFALGVLGWWPLFPAPDDAEFFYDVIIHSDGYDGIVDIKISGAVGELSLTSNGSVADNYCRVGEVRCNSTNSPGDIWNVKLIKLGDMSSDKDWTIHRIVVRERRTGGLWGLWAAVAGADRYKSVVFKSGDAELDFTWSHRPY